MPNASVAEFYFIGAMMILILILCAVAMFFFFRQLKREKNDAKIRIEKKLKEKENSKKENVLH